jgi:hypothetical protein
MQAERGPIAWVLNVGAERELEVGPGYSLSAALERATRRAAEAIGAELPPSDVVLGRDPDARARDLQGRCFCPTRSALRRLAVVHARVPEAPPEAVIRQVNERGFGYALGRLEGAQRCVTETEVRDLIGGGGRWILKRGLGFAGRGQRRIDTPPSAEDLRWVRASLRASAVYVEPRKELLEEFALHGWVEAAGRCVLGEPTIQVVSYAAWRASRRALPEELKLGERHALRGAASRVASALHAAGYFGPFGIDAFRYRDHGRTFFHPLSEVNARYTMAWGVGMGGWF